MASGLFALCGCLRPRQNGERRAGNWTEASLGYRTLMLNSVSSDGLTEAGITPSVEMGQPVVTDSRPATVQLSLTNEGTSTPTLQRVICPPADVHTGAHGNGNAQLALLLASEQSFEPVTPDCWRVRPHDFNVGQPCEPEEVTIPAGETVTRTYEVWDHPKNESCMPPGEYEFGETYHTGGREVEWRFTLTVESV